jgi:hypothetical protein
MALIKTLVEIVLNFDNKNSNIVAVYVHVWLFSQLVLQGMQSTLFTSGLYPGRQWQIEELLL